jgi:uncharacterized membrane protein YeiH
LRPVPGGADGGDYGLRGGGVIRDVIAGRPSIIMRPELYVTQAALPTSAICAGGHMAGLNKMIVDGRSRRLAGSGLRGAAIHWQLGLPADGPRGNRET